MSLRRFFLDKGVAEQRAVVTLAGRPERLMIVREADASVQGLGARVAARVRAIDRPQNIAFLDLGAGPDAVLNLAPGIGPMREGGWIEIEIRSEARVGKGANARWLGAAEGPARLLAPGPDLEQRLAVIAKGAVVEVGPLARDVADQAQEEALETVFPLAGGGTIAIEPTRALVAIDVDLGGSDSSKRSARTANLTALAEAARVLRLKGLGGLTVVDLAGRGHDGAALLAAAKVAFNPDNPGVAFGPISRFGTLELTVPRRARPTVEIIAGSESAVAFTEAMSLIRTLEREATLDGGGRFEAVAEEGVVAVVAPYMKRLTEKFGSRLSLQARAEVRRFEVRRV